MSSFFDPPPLPYSGSSTVVNNDIQATYGEAIPALRLVTMIGSSVFKTNHTDAAHANRVYGITVTAAASGATGTIRTFGRMQDASWNFTVPSLFAGLDGNLRTSPPTTGFSQLVARVESPDTIFIDLDNVYEMG